MTEEKTHYIFCGRKWDFFGYVPEPTVEGKGMLNIEIIENHADETKIRYKTGYYHNERKMSGRLS